MRGHNQQVRAGASHGSGARITDWDCCMSLESVLAFPPCPCLAQVQLRQLTRKQRDV